MTFDPTLDLVLERDIDISPELVWAAWTQPERLMKWFAPAPWTTVDCKIDLRPGGIFRTVMRSPEGTDYPNSGCYLELVENEKIIFTDALGPGYRPSATPFFTAIIQLTPIGTGTKYSVRAMHGSEAERKKHEDMGFHMGWGQCLDQLVATFKNS